MFCGGRGMVVEELRVCLIGVKTRGIKMGGEKIVFLDCLVEVESWRVLVGNKSFLIGPIKTQSPPNLGKNGAQIFGQNAHVTI